MESTLKSVCMIYGGVCLCSVSWWKVHSTLYDLWGSLSVLSELVESTLQCVCMIYGEVCAQ